MCVWLLDVTRSVILFPLQKWQRRFFILYEHGLLRYALDEMVSESFPPGSFKYIYIRIFKVYVFSVLVCHFSLSYIYIYFNIIYQSFYISIL